MVTENKIEYNTQKIRYISHEIKNQLSICDLYTEILKKYCEKNNIEDETILKSANCIKQAIKMAGNSLLELKSADTVDIKPYSVSELITETLELAKVYALNKNIKITTLQQDDANILVDKNKFEAVIINLIKNACEAFADEENKEIKINTKTENDIIKITVSNNAQPIEDVETIFKEGFTTKSNGNGLGLFICQENIKELSGILKLTKSDETETVFEITMKVI